MDIIKTVNYYRKLDKNSLCSCDYCRNYCLEIKKTYPIHNARYQADTAFAFAEKRLNVTHF
jgi:hypothetical protein